MSSSSAFWRCLFAAFSLPLLAHTTPYAQPEICADLADCTATDCDDFGPQLHLLQKSVKPRFVVDSYKANGEAESGEDAADMPAAATLAGTKGNAENAAATNSMDASSDSAATGALDALHYTAALVENSVSANATDAANASAAATATGGAAAEAANATQTAADMAATGENASGNATGAAGGAKKSKIVLLVIEMLPLVNALGIDRFYLGSNVHLAVAKCIVCVVTCFFGGVVWGTIDAVAVIVNGLRRDTQIDFAGMNASFEENSTDIERAQTLAVVAIVVHAFFFCASIGGLTMLKATIRRRFGRNTYSVSY